MYKMRITSVILALLMVACLVVEAIMIHGLGNQNEDLQSQIDDLTAQLSSVEVGVEQVSNDLTAYAEEQLPSIALPADIYVAAGTSVDVYNDCISTGANLEDYDFYWECSVGRCMEEQYRLDATADMVGEYELILRVYDLKCNLVAEDSTMLHIVEDVFAESESENANDSDTASSASASTTASTSASSTASGTSSDSSASSGATSSTSSGSSSATSGSASASGSGSDSAADEKNLNVLVIGDSLSASTYWLKQVQTLSGGVVNFVGTRGEEEGLMHEAVAGISAAEVLSGTLYGYDNDSALVNDAGAFDYAAYMAATGIQPDVVIVFLGTNGLSEDASSNVDSIEAVVDGVRAGDSDVPILVVEPIYCSYQDGMAQQELLYPSLHGMWALQRAGWIYSLHQTMERRFADVEGVTLVSLGAMFDREHGFTNVEVAVNAESSLTEVISAEGIHPSDEGYAQMGDVIYGALCYVVGEDPTLLESGEDVTLYEDGEVPLTE